MKQHKKLLILVMTEISPDWGAAHSPSEIVRVCRVFLGRKLTSIISRRTTSVVRFLSLLTLGFDSMLLLTAALITSLFYSFDAVLLGSQKSPTTLSQSELNC